LEAKQYVIKLYLIWAEFEVYKSRDKEKMIEIMNKVLSLECSANNFYTFISYEKIFGDIGSIRKTFKRAVEYASEENDTISEKWISWEKL
jgi:hypothetical protein